MTPAELQDFRARMGWTREHSAKTLGVALVTFDKYIYGAYPIPETISKICSLIDEIENLDN